MQRLIGSAVEHVLLFLDTYVPGFKAFHIWLNGLLDKQWLFYVVLGLIVAVAIYFYRKFQREDS